MLDVLLTGDFDHVQNEFVLQKVKHFSIESILKENQLDSLYSYLRDHKDEIEGKIITLNDQLPVRFNQEEVAQFLGDLDKVKSLYHQT